MKKATTVGLSVLIASAGFVAGSVDAVETGLPGCAAPTHEGGEWRSYGGNFQNHRNQPAEKTINAANAANLAKAWTFNVADATQAGGAGGGNLQNTAVVADGCVYLATSTGYVFALNADTGALVWRSPRLPGAAAGNLVGGVITGSPTVANGKVYVGVSRKNSPYVAALDQATGQPVWDTNLSIIDPAKGRPEYNTTTVSGPVLVDGMIFQGIMAAEETAGARGGYAFIDAETGALIKQEWTISDAEYAAGYRGASVWCTAAADEADKYVYACGGNPASKQMEARNANSLLKIDADRTRATFGQIVAAFKGNYDQYYPGLDRQPACDNVPTTLVWSPTCLQMDLDFGSSPSLYSINVAGQPVKLLGDLQKSGIYYATFADNMQLAWSTVVGGPAPVWNASSPAVDENNVYVAANPPGQVVSLTDDRGRYRWASPITSVGPHFESVSTANGLVYTVDNFGTVHIIDAATGLPVKHLSIAQEQREPIGSVSSHGISIARNTVFATAGSFVTAYR